jgi:hypothetical protein
MTLATIRKDTQRHGSGSIKPGRTRPTLDEFRRGIDQIANDFEADLRSQSTDIVRAYFAAARNCLRRTPGRMQWVYLLLGGLAAKEWLRRKGYSPAWTEEQCADIFAILQDEPDRWSKDWEENRIQ